MHLFASFSIIVSETLSTCYLSLFRKSARYELAIFVFLKSLEPFLERSFLEQQIFVLLLILKLLTCFANISRAMLKICRKSANVEIVRIIHGALSLHFFFLSLSYLSFSFPISFMLNTNVTSANEQCCTTAQIASRPPCLAKRHQSCR